MKALLALEDGFFLEGESFTGPIDEAGGEVIFNTAMTGYQELITDPSYTGQMVCMTWPLVGNYGINPEDMESGRVHLSALLVKECCKEPSNWRAAESLPAFLARHGVAGVEGLDTRALTLHLRTHGAMRGVVSTSEPDPEVLAARARRLPSMEGQNLVPRVAPDAPYRWAAECGHPWGKGWPHSAAPKRRLSTPTAPTTGPPASAPTARPPCALWFTTSASSGTFCACSRLTAWNCSSCRHPSALSKSRPWPRTASSCPTDRATRPPSRTKSPPSPDWPTPTPWRASAWDTSCWPTPWAAPPPS